MIDPIDRQAAVSRISDLLMLELKGRRLPTWDELNEAINELPSAQPDVPERNVGKWIDDCECSICHWIHEDDKGFALLTNYNFCPNCGTDMRKDRNNETMV